MIKNKKLGGFSALYLGIVYLVGIIIFLVVLDYANIIEPAQKLEVLVQYQMLIYVTNLLMYVAFGFFLITLMMVLYNSFKEQPNLLIQIAAAIGIIWAGLLIGSGMVSNAGIPNAVALFHSAPSEAIIYWLGVETVANGLGGANGEILGGVMTLLISIACLKSKLLSKGLHILGFIVGVIGIVSTLPGLSALAGVFGITQMIWFIWLGILIIRSK